MRKNLPYFIVASFLNAILVTGAFIEFKLQGITAPELPAAPQPVWYEINPFVFTGGIFVVSFLVITGIIAIGSLVAGIIKSILLHVTRYKLQGIHFKTQIRS